MKLFGFPRSSATWRVRITLNLKKLAYDSQTLSYQDGDLESASYRALNPLGVVPTLVDGPNVLTQSLAIVDYLQARHPEPSIYPEDPVQAAHARAIGQTVAGELQPLNNARVKKRLRQPPFNANDEAIADWCRFWHEDRFAAIERMLEACGSADYAFACADFPTIADICLVPQIFNAESDGVDLEPFPLIRRIGVECNRVQAFIDARPG